MLMLLVMPPRLPPLPPAALLRPQLLLWDICRALRLAEGGCPSADALLMPAGACCWCGLLSDSCTHTHTHNQAGEGEWQVGSASSRNTRGVGLFPAAWQRAAYHPLRRT